MHVRYAIFPSSMCISKCRFHLTVLILWMDGCKNVTVPSLCLHIAKRICSHDDTRSYRLISMKNLHAVQVLGKSFLIGICDFKINFECIILLIQILLLFHHTHITKKTISHTIYVCVCKINVSFVLRFEILLALNVVCVSTLESCVTASHTADPVGLDVPLTATCIVVGCKKHCCSRSFSV